MPDMAWSAHVAGILLEQRLCRTHVEHENAGRRGKLVSDSLKRTGVHAAVAFLIMALCFCAEVHAVQLSYLIDGPIVTEI